MKLVILFILLYFLISIINPGVPGVNNDQLMFVNTATLNPDNSFLWKSFKGVPIMIFPYIGALKSYLYMPIFYLFGVNIISIRLPQIIIICLSLFILYRSLTILFNKKIGIITILLLSLDPSLIIYSKTDQGPTVIEFFLKILTFYLMAKYLNLKKGYFLFAIFVTLALGIFNKLNFFWFVNSFLISFVIIYYKVINDNFKKPGKYFPFLLIAGFYFFLLRLFLKISREVTLSYRFFSNEVSPINIYNNLSIFLNNLSDLINGNLFFNKIYGYNPSALGIIFSFLTLSFLIFAFIYNFKKTVFRKLPFSKAYLFTLLIVLTLSIQILMTKRALSAWHVLILYPFLSILMAIGIYSILNTTKNVWIKLLVISFIPITVFFQIWINFIYLKNSSSPTITAEYSTSIYQLINYAKFTKGKFICLDVDICNQLLSFNQETGKYFEKFGYMDPDSHLQSFREMASNFNHPGDYLYITHSPKFLHISKFQENFFNYLNDNNVERLKIKEFSDGNNIIFEIYRIGYLKREGISQ